jgi:predicted membrane metal-binding protein
MTDRERDFRRSWIAIGLGTMVMVISYGSLLLAIVASRSDTPEAAGPAFAVGFALVPAVFVTVAFMSGRRNAPTAVLKAMGLWLLIALPLGLFNPVFGLSVAFGIGGVLTLKAPDTDSWKARSAAVLLVAVYSLMMLFVIPALGLMSGGLLPLASLGLMDWYVEYRSRPVGPG